MTTHSSELDAAIAGEEPRWAIVAPVAAQIAFVLELTLIPLVLPMIQQRFGLSLAELAWVFNSYAIAVAIGVLLGGWLGDAYRTRRVFGCGVLLFAAGALMGAVSDSYQMLMIGRALQGLGGGIFSPLVPLLLTRSAPDRPGRMLIFWGSIAGYAAAFAPLGYGLLLEDQSWSLTFIFLAAIAAVALISLLGPRLEGRETGGGTVARGLGRLFGVRDLWVTYLYVFCTYGAITYYLFRLPVWLSENDVGSASIGLALTVLWLTFSGLSTLLRNLVDGVHLRTITVAAPILVAAGVPLIYLSQGSVFLVLSALLVGAGLACSNAPSTQLILRSAPKDLSAVATSLDITFARIGGIATVGLLALAHVGFASAIICVVCFVALICALSVTRPSAEPA